MGVLTFNPERAEWVPLNYWYLVKGPDLRGLWFLRLRRSLRARHLRQPDPEGGPGRRVGAHQGSVKNQILVGVMSAQEEGSTPCRQK